MAGMMEDSDKAWRDSFDPTHADYHGGSQEVAPHTSGWGEKCVPKSMPSEFTDEPVKLVEESYPTDPEYLKTVALRSKF